MELFPIVQPPSCIDVDKNSIEELSCEPDPVTSSNIVPTVTGAHMMITTSLKGEFLHKEELSVSQAERDVHHCIKTNAPLQQCHASNRSVKPAAAQDASNSSHTKNSTQDTTSKTLETAGIVQDTELENKVKPSMLRINVLMPDNSKEAALMVATSGIV